MYYVKLTNNNSVTRGCQWSMNERKHVTGKIQLCSTGFHYYSGKSIEEALFKAYVYDAAHSVYISNGHKGKVFRCFPYGTIDHSYSKSCASELTTMEELSIPTFSDKFIINFACLVCLEIISNTKIISHQRARYIKCLLNSYLTSKTNISEKLHKQLYHVYLSSLTSFVRFVDNPPSSDFNGIMRLILDTAILGRDGYIVPEEKLSELFHKALKMK